MTASASGRLLLIGGAPHKQNEQAAELLAKARPEWLKGVVGIGVSSEVQNIVDTAFGPDFGIWRRGLSDAAVVEEYSNAQYFMLLGTDEGFGMPFVEGLAAGCQVIVKEHMLVRELLGDACTYLTDDEQTNCELLEAEPSVPLATRRAALANFSWDSFFEVVRDELVGVAKRRGRLPV